MAISRRIDMHPRFLVGTCRDAFVAAVWFMCLFAPVIGVRAAEPAAASIDGSNAFCEIQASLECQRKVTADMVLKRFKEGNERFVAGKLRKMNALESVKATAGGQFPLASVVSCIDSRAPAEILFDQGIGDLFNARVAGNVINDDILGSLEYAHTIAGAKLLIVLGHTGCGAIKGACDGVEMGHLTALLERIKPAIWRVSPDVQPRASSNPVFVDMVAESNVHMSVEAIREQSALLREMELRGEIRIVGAMYDVQTGMVTWQDME